MQAIDVLTALAQITIYIKFSKKAFMEIEGSNKSIKKDHRTHDLETLEFPQCHE